MTKTKKHGDDEVFNRDYTPNELRMLWEYCSSNFERSRNSMAVDCDWLSSKYLCVQQSSSIDIFCA